MKLNKEKKKNQLYKKLKIIKEERCDSCYGRGYYSVMSPEDNMYSDEYICEQCNGVGIIITNYSEHEK